jgi:hypothetical protein
MVDVSQPGNAALGYPPGGPGGPTCQWRYPPAPSPPGLYPARRPSGGTVITAAVIQIVQAAPLLILGLMAVALAVAAGTDSAAWSASGWSSPGAPLS